MKYYRNMTPLCTDGPLCDGPLSRTYFTAGSWPWTSCSFCLFWDQSANAHSATRCSVRGEDHARMDEWTDRPTASYTDSQTCAQTRYTHTHRHTVTCTHIQTHPHTYRQKHMHTDTRGEKEGLARVPHRRGRELGV